MISLTDYTSYDEVRAALGVESDEITDASLGLDFYASSLLVALQDISDDLPADYTIIKAKDDSLRTDAEEKVYSLIRLFSVYEVASTVATGLALSAPKQVTDGKASTIRDAAAPYKVVMTECQAARDNYATRLASAYADYKGTTNSTTVLPTLFANVTLSPDPVTGS